MRTPCTSISFNSASWTSNPSTRACRRRRWGWGWGWKWGKKASLAPSICRFRIPGAVSRRSLEDLQPTKLGGRIPSSPGRETLQDCCCNGRVEMEMAAAAASFFLSMLLQNLAMCGIVIFSITRTTRWCDPLQSSLDPNPRSALVLVKARKTLNPFFFFYCKKGTSIGIDLVKARKTLNPFLLQNSMTDSTWISI